MVERRRRLALLAEARLTPLDAKTAVGLLRYRPESVVAVIDSTRAGVTAQACVGTGGAIPVVASLDGAAACGADALVIGVAPQGGGLPDAWRPVVIDALTRGWDVIAGLHEFLADDPELASLAAARGARLVDVRRPPGDRLIATRRAASVEALVTLTVGSDCNVGKMTAALELDRALRERGRRTSFVATGQTGILIAGHGVPVDAVPSDFVAGLVEREVVAAAGGVEVVLVEGQGALHHPAYSGVTLGLLHGSCPRALVLCHHAGRTTIRGPGGRTTDSDPSIPPLAALVKAYEQAAAWVAPARTIGVALNTLGLDDEAARHAVATAAADTGLPACDPVRFGAGPLADALEAMLETRRTHATSS